MYWDTELSGWKAKLYDDNKYSIGGIYYDISRHTWVGYVGKGSNRKAKTFGGFEEDAKRWVESHIKQSNPPKDKWIPAKAVKFNPNGSVSLRK